MKNGVRTDKKIYTVTASGGNYYLDGALKPTLNAYRGGTYTFDYTGATSHPFYLSPYRMVSTIATVFSLMVLEML